MRFQRRFFLFVFFGILLIASPSFAAKKVALIVGNSAYKTVPRLANPTSDANAIGELFQKAKFDIVDVKLDQSIIDFRRTLRDFSDKARDADIAIIFFAGHGVELEGINYLIPTDAVLERERDAFDEAIQLERILQTIEPAKSLRLVILDACRDNPFLPRMVRTSSRSLTRGLAGIEPNRPNTLIAFAAKGGSTADDGATEHSPFTTALLKHLTTPGLDLRKALGIVRDDVMKQTGNKQEPFVYGSLGGTDVALVDAPPPTPPNATPALPSAISPSTADARKDYEFALQIGTKDVWDAFLAAHPSGYFADLAKAQLRRIASTSPAVSAPKTEASPVPSRSANEEKNPRRQVDEERQKAKVKERQEKAAQKREKEKTEQAERSKDEGKMTCSSIAADCRRRSTILGPEGIAKCSDYLRACLRSGTWTSPFRTVPGLAKR